MIVFGVFVEPLGSYFIVFQIESSDDMLSRTAVWKISGQIVGGVWEPSAKERLTVIGPAECSLSLRLSEGGALVAVSAANLSNNYMFYYNKAYAIVTGDIRCLACPCHCARRDGAHHAP